MCCRAAICIHAGSTSSAQAADCNVARTSQAENTFTLARSTTPSQQCVCTTCEGPQCASHFWLPGTDRTCPYRPPLHLLPGVTTYFRFQQEATGQQPSVTGLQGGNWCRFQSGGSFITGYIRNGVCNGPDASSATFEVFCPYAVSTCSTADLNACGRTGLVNPTTRRSCSCDYWCQVYGDCCGANPSSIAAQCPSMTPSIDRTTTGSCPAGLGVGANQAACASYRPRGTFTATMFAEK